MTDKKRQHIPKFYATWSKSSSVLNCIISLSSFKTPDIDVEISTTFVKVRGKQTTCVFSIPSVTLQPDSCRGLKIVHENELHFSIKGILPDGLESSLTPDQQARALSNQSTAVDSIERLQNKWYCALCRQKVLSDWCIFNRVLPLPSENWSDFADMWFCHNHGNNGVARQPQKRLLPGVKECLVAETYVMVMKQYVNEGHVKVTKPGVAICRRCGQQLGVVMGTGKDTSEVLKLYLHAVLIKDFASLELTSQCFPSTDRLDLDSFFSRLILEQSQTYSSFRFILETESSVQNSGSAGTSVCLLWLMDSSSTMFTSEVVGDWGSEVKVTQTHVLKLLFKCQLFTQSKRPVDYVTKSVVSLWRKDDTVHGFTLPHPVFLQLIQLLVINCKRVPDSQRYLNGFHVSYLQHSVS